MTSIALASIRLDGGTQSRAELSEEVIARYAESVLAGVKLPAPVVFYDGSEYWLADGFHRVKAFAKAARPRIDCDVRQGSLRDAVLFSVGANATHGLPRTNADKRRAVEILLRDEEWSQRSDRWIAQKCCVDHKVVGRSRDQLGLSPGSPTPRAGQDGKTRKLPGPPPGKAVPPTPVAPAVESETPVRKHSGGPPRVDHDARRAEVTRLHELGKGTSEIAATTGLHKAQVSVLKKELGIAENSPAIKLWADVQRTAHTLGGVTSFVEELVERTATEPPSHAERKDIEQCARILAETSRSARALRQNLLAWLTSTDETGSSSL